MIKGTHGSALAYTAATTQALNLSTGPRQTGKTTLSSTRRVFVLTGSSARRVRRSPANLLGGRALRDELFGLVANELDADFDQVRILNQDYQKEKVLAESLSRDQPVFSKNLPTAALSDTAATHYAMITPDRGACAHKVRGYVEALVDTRLGQELPAYVRRPKRRTIRAPKFLFSNISVVSLLARRGHAG